jgi:hypothetical protein
MLDALARKQSKRKKQGKGRPKDEAQIIVLLCNARVAYVIVETHIRGFTNCFKYKSLLSLFPLLTPIVP